MASASCQFFVLPIGSAMPRFLVFVSVCATILLTASCSSPDDVRISLNEQIAPECSERNETKSDISRYWEKQKEEPYLAAQTAQRLFQAELANGRQVSVDVDRFILWRKKQWWVLQDNLDYLVHYERQQIEKLFTDTAAFFHYDVVNFPKSKQAFLSFLKNADDEWLNLVQDVSIYIEFQKSQTIHMQEWLRRFYDDRHKEWANVTLDVTNFLEWREREYSKLVKRGKEYFYKESGLVDDLMMDVQRYGELTRTEAAWFSADMKAFWSDHVQAEVPRLIDGMHRFTLLQQQEDLERIRGYFHEATIEGRRLADAVGRFKNKQRTDKERLLEEVRNHLKTYEYEVAPLQEDVKRFWEYNVSKGAVAIDSMKRFYDLTDSELFELEAALGRFVSYGGVEWTAFREGFQRFICTGYDPAFGSSATPYGGNAYGSGIKNIPVYEDGAVNIGIE